MPVTGSLKKIALLAPKPGMTFEAFQRHWLDVHGPVVANSPDYARYRLRYVQNHIAAEGPVGAPFAFGGMAEFWLPGENEVEFAATSTYRGHIRPDEERFIDMDRTVSVTAVEQVLIDGAGPVKLIVLSTRSERLPHRAFQDEMSGRYARTIVADFGSLLRGFALNHVAEGSAVRPGARASDSLDIDCVQEMWFASAAALDVACRNPEFLTALVGGAAKTTSFVAREFVFFDKGVPARPPVPQSGNS